MVKIGQLFCFRFSALSAARQKKSAAVKQMLEAGSGSHASSAEARDALWCIGSNISKLVGLRPKLPNTEQVLKEVRAGMKPNYN